jgi:hypothetical protein
MDAYTGMDTNLLPSCRDSLIMHLKRAIRLCFGSQLPRYCQTSLDLMGMAGSPKTTHYRSNGLLMTQELVDIMIGSKTRLLQMQKKNLALMILIL